MVIAALLLALSSAVHAAQTPSCPDSLRRAFEGGDTAVLGCFAPEARWRGAGGVFEGPRGARRGLRALLMRRPRADAGGLLSWRLGDSGFITGFSTEDDRPWRESGWSFLPAGCVPGAEPRYHHVLVTDGPPGRWTEARLYSAADPWPAPPPEVPPIPESVRDRLFAGFNKRFNRGDVAGWLKSWHPDAVFYSLIGPLRGKEIETFFLNQSARYVEPHFVILREHDAGRSGRLLAEGEIRGRCRSNGHPFRLEALLEVRVKDGLLYRVQEAFREVRDGCGPFWK